MPNPPPARVQASGDGGEAARRETEDRKARIQEIAHRCCATIWMRMAAPIRV
jgi:hypothetical protein